MTIRTHPTETRALIETSRLPVPRESHSQGWNRAGDVAMSMRNHCIQRAHPGVWLRYHMKTFQSLKIGRHCARNEWRHDYNGRIRKKKDAFIDWHGFIFFNTHGIAARSYIWKNYNTIEGKERLTEWWLYQQVSYQRTKSQGLREGPTFQWEKDRTNQFICTPQARRRKIGRDSLPQSHKHTYRCVLTAHWITISLQQSGYSTHADDWRITYKTRAIVELSGILSWPGLCVDWIHWTEPTEARSALVCDWKMSSYMVNHWEPIMRTRRKGEQPTIQSQNQMTGFGHKSCGLFKYRTKFNELEWLRTILRSSR